MLTYTANWFNATKILENELFGKKEDSFVVKFKVFMFFSLIKVFRSDFDGKNNG